MMFSSLRWGLNIICFFSYKPQNEKNMLALSCEAFLRLAPERSYDSEEKDVGVFALKNDQYD